MLTMTHRLMAVAAALVAGIVASGTVTGANLIVNGSFENPQLNPNQVMLLSSIPGWSIEPAGSSALIEVQRVNAAGTPAADGEQYVELDSNQSSRIFQIVTTDVGQGYELSWWFSPRPGTLERDNYLGVYVDDVLVATSGPQAGLGGYQNSWTRFSYVFTATQTSTKISFADLGPSDSVGTYLDDVRLVAIPEPAFLQMGALVAMGLAGGLRLRRR
ncbi:MAG: hypothetical protein KatS3mg024_2565 [Armatimonadota bacterium]|nr:MAG: hypothetical protein KatS3mg024_2565 [Armatimonadota bacterium]